MKPFSLIVKTIELTLETRLLHTMANQYTSSVAFIG